MVPEQNFQRGSRKNVALYVQNVQADLHLCNPIGQKQVSYHSHIVFSQNE